MPKTTITLLKRLVGNPRAYAVQQQDGSYRPVRKPLWRGDALMRHLKGERTVGTYINHSDKARTLVFDIDSGNPDEATKLVDTLVSLGFPQGAPAIEDSGRKGYHVWLVFNEYVPAADLRRVGRAALAASGVECEVFPKQDVARDLGNLVKLPGGIHQVTGKRAEFVNRLPRPVHASKLGRVLMTLPKIKVSRKGTWPTPFACMTKIQEGVEEGGRNNSLFHLAVMARRGGLTSENVESLLRSVNEKCDPPVDENELQGVLDSSENSGPLCNSLPGELSCKEECILRQVKGLHVRRGRVKHAAPGEFVVVEVESRSDDLVELAHPDLIQGTAVVKESE